jgi:hypothetical protein
VVRADGLEAHLEQEVGRGDAAGLVLVRLVVAESFDGLHAALGQVFGDGLHQDPAEAAAAELRQHLQRGHQHGVGADRGRGERE